MNKITTLLLLLGIIACKQNHTSDKNQPYVEQETSEENTIYPDALSKVFEAHGSLKQWKKQRTLTFLLPKTNFSETHTIDLWSRMDRVDTEQFSMGFDGEQAWLMNGSGNYEGDPGFYHNLMFYFYAMPFVFADDGIMYSEAEDLKYDGKSYPGIKIAYRSGVGASSKDEYFIHFNPETYEMAWLGYTVTYRSGESSENVRWINYTDWQEVNGLLLPKSITWHNYEGRQILDPVSTVTFEKVMLSQGPNPVSFYARPEEGEFVN
ncbi:MAG: DUF6503 family protein [Bacteroidota bacterium]|uniref:DUF6503 family protein n=1 Tax=Flagellimonas okinawensis TaxID=3031324 RepID=A0ABT5XKD5_9FLAO|nr:DUF6503 family protein [[Muricauda] okinawensis]MDF0706349.1 DUF6503 family protein [[Muricauda] okinawensis]MEC8831932.1 DUF6503 family protein [Bacteroidota bacterium]